MDEEDIKLENMDNFPEIDKDSINISLREIDHKSISSLKNVTQHKGGDLYKSGQKSDILLNFIQRVHDMFYQFQNKLKANEGISGYADYESLKMLSPTKWKNLESIEIESTMQVVLDYFENTFKFIYNEITVMDCAVARLKNENKKNADVLNELNQRYSKTFCKMDSPEDQYHSIIIDDLKYEKKDLSKQCKKQKERIFDLKESIEQLKSENYDLEAKYDTTVTENKKLVKEIKDLQDDSNSTQREHFSKSFKLMNGILKEIQETNAEIKEQKDTPDRTKFKGLENKLDSIIESLREKDFCGDKKSEILIEIRKTRDEIHELRAEYEAVNKSEILEEIKKTRHEVISWKEQCENTFIAKDKALKVLRARITGLFTDLHNKDEELRQQDARFKSLENQFIGHEDVEYLAHELDSIICKCHKSKRDHISSALLKYGVTNDKIYTNDQEKDEIRNKYKSLIGENAVLKDEIKEYGHRVNDLNNEIRTLKTDIAKKQLVINNMKEKIMKLNNLESSVEEMDKLKRRVEQFDKEKQSMEQLIISLRGKMKERYEDCEQLKKDKLRLEAEFNNMKKLNFQKKTNGSID